ISAISKWKLVIRSQPPEIIIGADYDWNSIKSYRIEICNEGFYDAIVGKIQTIYIAMIGEFTIHDTTQSWSFSKNQRITNVKQKTASFPFKHEICFSTPIYFIVCFFLIDYEIHPPFREATTSVIFKFTDDTFNSNFRNCRAGKKCKSFIAQELTISIPVKKKCENPNCLYRVNIHQNNRQFSFLHGLKSTVHVIFEIRVDVDFLPPSLLEIRHPKFCLIQVNFNNVLFFNKTKTDWEILDYSMHRYRSYLTLLSQHSVTSSKNMYLEYDLTCYFTSIQVNDDQNNFLDYRIYSFLYIHVYHLRDKNNPVAQKSYRINVKYSETVKIYGSFYLSLTTVDIRSKHFIDSLKFRISIDRDDLKNFKLIYSKIEGSVDYTVTCNDDARNGLSCTEYSIHFNPATLKESMTKWHGP
ncbi:hypothetical protein MXB_412, partial [Myxobolus squamalis]